MAFGKYGREPVDQARAGRMVLAVLDDDTWAMQAVIGEIAADARRDSTVHLIVALAEQLATEWTKHVTVQEAREQLAFRLIEYEEEKDK